MPGGLAKSVRSSDYRCYSRGLVGGLGRREYSCLKSLRNSDAETVRAPLKRDFMKTLLSGRLISSKEDYYEVLHCGFLSGLG